MARRGASLVRIGAASPVFALRTVFTPAQYLPAHIGDNAAHAEAGAVLVPPPCGFRSALAWVWPVIAPAHAIVCQQAVTPG